MFDQEFYPTPATVIDRMLDPLMKSVGSIGRLFDQDRFGKTPQILEPSAGKGDILDKITGTRWNEMCGEYRRSFGAVDIDQCFAIETNPDLQAVLRKKGYRLIDTDFLQHQPDYSYDIILMNPPFSNGDQHLLHAWEILESGSIACVLNADTIRNRFSRNREALGSIIDSFGDVEYIGPAFAQAERKTGAEIAVVWLHKTSERTRFEFNFTPVKSDKVDLDETAGIAGGVVLNDRIGAYLATYDNTKAALIEYLKARELVKFYGFPLVNPSRRSLAAIMDDADKKDGIKAKYNAFVTDFKEQAWYEILRKVNIEKYLTSNVRRNFAEWQKQQGGMDLNRQNIHALMMSLVNGKDEIMKQAAVEVFDYMTKYHAENRMVPEGWKTNSMYKVNQRVILPYVVEKAWSGNTFNLRSSYNGTDVRDIDKVMCWLSGKDYDAISTIEKTVRDHDNFKSGESEFFEMRWFIKGTLHLKFKDKDLWARFNQVACDNKNWIGG